MTNIKTSPPSARVAAMSDMQQQTFKNRTTLKHPHKSSIKHLHPLENPLETCLKGFNTRETLLKHSQNLLVAPMKLS